MIERALKITMFSKMSKIISYGILRVSSIGYNHKKFVLKQEKKRRKDFVKYGALKVINCYEIQKVSKVEISSLLNSMPKEDGKSYLNEAVVDYFSNYVQKGYCVDCSEYETFIQHEDTLNCHVLRILQALYALEYNCYYEVNYEEKYLKKSK